MLDTQLSVLSNAQRRRLLLVLLEHNPQADQTVTSSDSATTDGGQKGQNQSITMAHVHLPQLEDHGYINWDQEEQSVTKGSQFDEIRPLLTVLTEIQDENSDDGAFDKSLSEA